MRYSSLQVRRMTFQQWIETCVKELNSAGFKANGYNSETGKWQDNFSPYDVGDPEFFFLGELNDANALEYLKSIGLVNNGRCPLCGNSIEGNPGRFTSGHNPSFHFQICQNCANRGGKMSMNHANNTGCIISLMLMPWHLIKGVITSIGNCI